jgi:hypothetical protein
VSLTIDFSQVWTQASDFVNNMWPVFIVPIGIVLGVGILNFIIKAVRSALGAL